MSSSGFTAAMSSSVRRGTPNRVRLYLASMPSTATRSEWTTIGCTGVSGISSRSFSSAPSSIPSCLSGSAGRWAGRRVNMLPGGPCVGCWLAFSVGCGSSSRPVQSSGRLGTGACEGRQWARLCLVQLP
eukprot:1187446-Prorocentrum_minimum.AAC.2